MTMLETEQQTTAGSGTDRRSEPMRGQMQVVSGTMSICFVFDVAAKTTVKQLLPTLLQRIDGLLIDAAVVRIRDFQCATLRIGD